MVNILNISFCEHKSNLKTKQFLVPIACGNKIFILLQQNIRNTLNETIETVFELSPSVAACREFNLATQSVPPIIYFNLEAAQREYMESRYKNIENQINLEKMNFQCSNNFVRKIERIISF